jgi:hypothetical protein
MRCVHPALCICASDFLCLSGLIFIHAGLANADSDRSMRLLATCLPVSLCHMCVHMHMPSVSVCNMLLCHASPCVCLPYVYILYAICRVGQNHIYTVYIRYFWQGNHQIYGHIRCIYIFIRFWPTLAICRMLHMICICVQHVCMPRFSLYLFAICLYLRLARTVYIHRI